MGEKLRAAGSSPRRGQAVKAAPAQAEKPGPKVHKGVTHPRVQGGPAYSLPYIMGYAEAGVPRHPGERRAEYSASTGTWRLRVCLDEKALWFLSVFVKESGQFEKFSLDEEAANDSHYEFRDEQGLRKAVYAPGDEKKYLAEVLVRYTSEKGGYALLGVLRPFITAEYHFD